MTIRPAKIEAFVHEGRVRVAMVRCPICAKLHEHVVPEDILPHAELVRSPKCGGKKAVGVNYRLILPGDWTDEHEASTASAASKAATVGRVYTRESLDGQRFGGLVVLCDGPDLIVEVKGKERKRRRFFVRCECGRIPLIPATSLKSSKSCGCSVGRPKDCTGDYEAWVKQGDAVAS